MFCYQKMFWAFTAWINCSSDLKNFANSGPSASNFKSFSQSVEHFFLTLGQNNFSNKIPLFESKGHFFQERAHRKFDKISINLSTFKLLKQTLGSLNKAKVFSVALWIFKIVKHKLPLTFWGWIFWLLIKFSFSEKATKMCAIVLMVLKFT